MTELKDTGIVLYVLEHKDLAFEDLTRAQNASDLFGGVPKVMKLVDNGTSAYSEDIVYHTSRKEAFCYTSREGLEMPRPLFRVREKTLTPLVAVLEDRLHCISQEVEQTWEDVHQRVQAWGEMRAAIASLLAGVIDANARGDTILVTANVTAALRILVGNKP